MSSRKRRRREPSRTPGLRDEAQTHPEDLFAAASADRKSLSLCAQVRRAIELAIGVDCRDEVLIDLIVLDVWPDPTTRRLRVWLRGPAGMDAGERENILRRLAAARGFLRSQVAEAIHRKRTPELAFELLSGTAAKRCER